MNSNLAIETVQELYDLKLLNSNDTARKRLYKGVKKTPK